MSDDSNLKHNILDHLRFEIAEISSQAKETTRAEADLLAISFQSALIPSRHIWVSIPSVESYQFLIDLEDWEYEGTWDNSVSHVKATTLGAAVTVCAAWLEGKDVESCLSSVKDGTAFLQE